MAGVQVVYDNGKFAWTYMPGVTPATELRLKVGTSPGVYPIVKAYGPATTGANVSTVLPAGSTGQFYAKLVTANSTKEGVASAELPFVCGDGSPDGSLNFSIG